MDIARISMNLSQAKAEQQAGIGLLKKVMDVSSEVADILVADLAALDVGAQAPRIVDISV